MRRARFEERYAGGYVPWDDPLPPPEVIALAAELDPGRALDLGAGYGRAAIYLAAKGWRVEAVEYVERAIDEARERAEAAGVAERITFHQGDVTQLDALPLSVTFDVAIDVGCLHGQPPDGLAALRDGLRARIRPGGILLVFAHLRRAAQPHHDDAGPTGLDEAIFRALFLPDFRLADVAYGTTTAGTRGEVPSAWFRMVRR